MVINFCAWSLEYDTFLVYQYRSTWTRLSYEIYMYRSSIIPVSLKHAR